MHPLSARRTRSPVFMGEVVRWGVLTRSLNVNEPIERPYRSAWHDFPDVVIAASETQVKQHPEYAQAKAGDVNQAAPAAKRLSAAMLSAQFLEAVHALRTTLAQADGSEWHVRQYSRES